jgi:hypothetical protein
MKKFLAVLAIAGTLVACNNEGENTTATDSTTVTNSTVDSTVVTPLDTTAVAPMVDTAATTDTTTHSNH